MSSQDSEHTNKRYPSLSYKQPSIHTYPISFHGKPLIYIPGENMWCLAQRACCSVCIHWEQLPIQGREAPLRTPHSCSPNYNSDLIQTISLQKIVMTTVFIMQCYMSRHSFPTNYSYYTDYINSIQWTWYRVFLAMLHYIITRTACNKLMYI